MASFNARYPGRCADCDEWFSPGELVRYVHDDELVHEECGSEEPKLPESPPCQHCWLVHAGECL